MLGRFNLETSLQVRAVINPNIQSKPRQMAVCVMFPQLSDIAK